MVFLTKFSYYFINVDIFLYSYHTSRHLKFITSLFFC